MPFSQEQRIPAPYSIVVNELLGLARNEAAVATGRWYALTRISNDLRATVEELERWDRSAVPLEESLRKIKGSVRDN